MLLLARRYILYLPWLTTIYYLTRLISVYLQPIHKVLKIPVNCSLMLLLARRYILYLPWLTSIYYLNPLELLSP